MADLTLTARDLALLASLRGYRLLTSGQLQAMHFASRQTALRRLRQLAAAGYLRVWTVPSLRTRVLTLGPRGAAQLPDGDAVEPTLLRPSQRSAVFLPHLIAVNEFRLRLEAACAHHADLTLVRFISDSERAVQPGSVQPRPLIRQEVRDPGQSSGTLARVPDGVFALRRGGKSALFFLEVDRGTEVIGHQQRGIGKIVQFYSALLLAGDYQRHGEVFGTGDIFRGFRLLLVLHSPRRLNNIRAQWGCAVDVAPQARRFIWLASAPTLFAGALLDQPWVSLDPADVGTYTLGGGRVSEGGAR